MNEEKKHEPLIDKSLIGHISRAENGFWVAVQDISSGMNCMSRTQMFTVNDWPKQETHLPLAFFSSVNGPNNWTHTVWNERVNFNSGDFLVVMIRSMYGNKLTAFDHEFLRVFRAYEFLGWCVYKGWRYGVSKPALQSDTVLTKPVLSIGETCARMIFKRFHEMFNTKDGYIDVHRILTRAERLSWTRYVKPGFCRYIDIDGFTPRNRNNRLKYPDFKEKPIPAEYFYFPDARGILAESILEHSDHYKEAFLK